ncbi:M56 family metallopeptidase [Paludisphaera rhizosphaerae]|uniref:M56 family metallopeptidase n=1 Tax=Paludisphaera rhizosphaerae TaxID=2711216 RepID=UPI0013ECF38F|nr:M56 family metallopeptidase [Paludisphaera rhizosphaerae]
MNINTSSAVWTALGWTFLHVGWIGVIVGLAASLVRRSLRRAPAEVRHAAALVSLLSLAASPFIAFAVVYEPAHAPISPPTATITQPDSSPQARAVVVNERPSIRPTLPTEPTIASRWFEPWIDVLPGVWLAGTLMILVRTTIGLAGVERLRRTSTPLRDGPVAELCHELARSLGIAREVGLAVCDRIAGPLLIGVIRPTILLPAAALSGWAPDQLEMALLHELAHLRRRDNLVCLFQQLVEALLFFHPTTWWLSAWLRLERETCCDQRVVARTGRPRAYAELLATLAGAGSSTPPCPAMTERPIATRIRRILFKEDRPMPLKPTVPETLALAAATLLAAALAIPTRAEAPKLKADAAADLKRIAASLAALPPTPGVDADGEPDPRTMALLMIAERQNTQGDRAGALETLKHVKIDPPNDRDLWRDRKALFGCELLMMLATERYNAGEVAEARGDFRRLIEVVTRPNPADAKLLNQMARVFRIIIEKKSGSPDGPTGTIDEAVRLAAASGEDVPQGDMEVFFGRLEMPIAFLSALAKLREVDLMNSVAASIDGWLELSDDSVLAATIKGHVGVAYIQAGEDRRGREYLADARKRIDAMPAGPVREGVAQLMVGTTAEADLDAALNLLPTLPSARRNHVLRDVLQRGVLSTITPTPWEDPAGIKITIGDPDLAPTEQARLLLPRFVALARTIEEAPLRARTLAVLAHLQVQGGDPTGAMATAEAIPDIHRPEAPVDGFHDSVKPATFALIGWRLAKAGDPKAADAAFARSRDLARAVPSDPERVIAWIVLAEKLEATGRRDQANAVLADAIPLAKTQPEPRRSRMLSMLSRTQLKTAGVDAATTTIDAIRDEPGVEKGYALNSLAHTLHTQGDDEAASRVARRALACLEPKPSDPKPVPNDQRAVSRISFIDYDQETPASWLAMQRANPQAALRKLAGDPTPPPAGPPWQQQMQRSADVADAFHRGGLDEALRTVEALDSPTSKASALQRLAYEVASEEKLRK